MNIMKKKPLRQVAALLVLASCSTIASAETGTEPRATDASTQATATATPFKNTAPREPCHYGVCQESYLDDPKLDTVVGSDVMPGFYSPALNPTVEKKTGC